MRRDISPHWRDEYMDRAHASNAAMGYGSDGILPLSSRLVAGDSGYTVSEPRDAGNAPKPPFTGQQPIPGSPPTQNRYEVRKDFDYGRIQTKQVPPEPGAPPVYSFLRRDALHANLATIAPTASRVLHHPIAGQQTKTTGEAVDPGDILSGVSDYSQKYKYGNAT